MFPKKNTSEKVVGILGLAPYATIDFIKKITDLTPARKDWEHLRLLIDSNTKIPSRGRCLELGEESPVPKARNAIQNLVALGADFVVIPCNTAHIFYDELSNGIGTEIINIIDTTTQYLVQKYPSLRRVGVLASKNTVNHRLYEKSFSSTGIAVIVPSENVQEQVSQIIEKVKVGKISREVQEEIQKISNDLITQDGVEGIILGCTELSLLLKNGDLSVPVFDSNEILARKVIQKAKGSGEIKLHENHNVLIDSHDIKQFWETRANASKDKPINDAVASKLEEDPQLLKLKLELENKKVAEYVTLKPTDLVVDLGSGQGYWAEMFAKVAKKVYAVEFCAGFVEQAKKSAQEKNISNIECIHAPAQDFKSDLKFDFIFISGLIVYLVDKEFEELLKNIFSFSKKGTLLILRDGTGIKGRHEISNKYSEVLKTKYSAIYRTREEYITAFENIGFKLIKDENMFVEDCCLNKYSETRLRIYQFVKVI